MVGNEKFGQLFSVSLVHPRGLRRVLRPLAYWDFRFESRTGHACLSFVSVVCCQVEVSASGWSLVQMSPSECVCVCVCVCAIVKSRKWGGPGPLGAVALRKKKSAVPDST